MNILVTAGNTQTPIDRVRCITNIFSGRTGTKIALAAHERGHTVRLLTSHPEVVGQLAPGRALDGESWTVSPYRTFDELRALMAEVVPGGAFDAIVHCAAVSDYSVAGVYAPAHGSDFDEASKTWRSSAGPPRLTDVSANKIRSQHNDLWLRLERTSKLVDMIRAPWGFRGVLVKFKLEAGPSKAKLLEIAELSRRQSLADLMVANTLDGMHEAAYIGAVRYVRVPRAELPVRLLREIEARALRG